MAYLIVSILFFVMGYKISDVVFTARMLRDKIFIEKVVNKIFGVGEDD